RADPVLIPSAGPQVPNERASCDSSFTLSNRWRGLTLAPEPPIGAPTPGAQRRSVPRTNDCYGCMGTVNADWRRAETPLARRFLPGRGSSPERLRRQNVLHG